MGGEELYQEGEREPSDKRADESKLPEEFGHDLDRWAHCFAQVCCRPTAELRRRRESIPIHRDRRTKLVERGAPAARVQRFIRRRGSQRYRYCNSLRRP